MLALVNHVTQQQTQTFAGMVFGNVITADAEFKQLLFGNLPYARNFLARKDAHIITRSEQLLKEAFNTIRTCESENVKVRERFEID